ncbi:MAG: hypothetical protein MPJ24_06230 [Pirellulaceae bacterium]|nr:hypothetical protein [Pirellulaceae bacterium]
MSQRVTTRLAESPIVSLLFLFTLLFSSPTNETRGQDQVFFHAGKGGVQTGEILSVSSRKIELKTKKETLGIEVLDIKKVVFDYEPASLTKGREALQKGRFEQAAQHLTSLDLNDFNNRQIRQEILFYTAFAKSELSQSVGGNRTEALNLLQQFLTDQTDSWHYYHAAELAGQLALSSGQEDKAQNYFTLFAQSPWPEYQLRGAVYQTEAFLAQENYEAALNKITEIKESPLSTEAARTQKLFAQVNEAICLAETGKLPQAIQQLEELHETVAPSDHLLLAKIHNALGHAYQRHGNTEAALLAYLHVDLISFQDPQEHAQALYFLSKLWPKLDHSERGLTAKETLKNRYPGSSWALRK